MLDTTRIIKVYKWLKQGDNRCQKTDGWMFGTHNSVVWKKKQLQSAAQKEIKGKSLSAKLIIHEFLQLFLTSGKWKGWTRMVIIWAKQCILVLQIFCWFCSSFFEHKGCWKWNCITKALELTGFLEKICNLAYNSFWIKWLLLLITWSYEIKTVAFWLKYLGKLKGQV